MTLSHRCLLPMLLLLAACGSTPPAPAGDTTPPQITAATPTMTGSSMTLGVTITDDRKVARLTAALDDADAIDLVLTGGGPSYTVTLTGVLPGDHHVTLTAYDAGGLASTPVTVAFTVADVTPPDPAQLSASRYWVADLNPVTLTASSQDDVGVARVQFYQADKLLGTDDTPADGFTWTLSFTPADNYGPPFHAVAVDAAGNASEPGPEIGINIRVGLDPNGPDLTAPVVLATSELRMAAWIRDAGYSSGNVTVTSGREPQVIVTTQDDRGVTALEYRLDGGPLLTRTNDGWGSFAFPLPSLALGAHVLTVWALDLAGNRSAPRELPYTLTDMVPPTFTALTTPQLEPHGAAYHMQLRVDATDDQGVTALTITDGDATRTMPVSGPGPYTVDLGIRPLGTTPLRVRVQDASGLVQGRDMDLVVRDVDAPTTPTLTPEKLQVDGLTPLTLTVSGGTDNVGVTGYDLFMDGRNIGFQPRTAQGNATFTVTVPNTQTSATFQAVATDHAGNASPRTPPVTVGITIRDLTPPNTPDLTITPDYPVNAGQVVTLRAITDADVVRAVFTQSDSYSGIPTLIGTDSDPSDGFTWTGTAPLNQPTVWYWVTVYDAAGNSSSRALWRDLIDTVGPVVFIHAQQQPGTTDVELTFELSDRSGVLSSTVSLQGGPAWPLTTQGIIVRGLAPGTYTVTVVSEDTLHNRSTTTGTFTISSPTP